MRTSKEISDEIQATRDRLAALELELSSARMAELRVDIRADDLVERKRGGKRELFTVAVVKPMSGEGGNLYGYKHKKDGTPGKACVYIGSIGGSSANCDRVLP